MKKNLSLAILALASCLFVTGCGENSSKGSSSSQGEASTNITDIKEKTESHTYGLGGLAFSLGTDYKADGSVITGDSQTVFKMESFNAKTDKDEETITLKGKSDTENGGYVAITNIDTDFRFTNVTTFWATDTNITAKDFTIEVGATKDSTTSTAVNAVYSKAGDSHEYDYAKGYNYIKLTNNHSTDVTLANFAITITITKTNLV
ncbi:MAG: hypothetical protein WCR56_06580 [Bacilli bacterium]